MTKTPHDGRGELEMRHPDWKSILLQRKLLPLSKLSTIFGADLFTYRRVKITSISLVKKGCLRDISFAEIVTKRAIWTFMACGETEEDISCHPRSAPMCL